MNAPPVIDPNCKFNKHKTKPTIFGFKFLNCQIGNWCLHVIRVIRLGLLFFFGGNSSYKPPNLGPLPFRLNGVAIPSVLCISICVLSPRGFLWKRTGKDISHSALISLKGNWLYIWLIKRSEYSRIKGYIVVYLWQRKTTMGRMQFTTRTTRNRTKRV